MRVCDTVKFIPRGLFDRTDCDNVTTSWIVIAVAVLSKLQLNVTALKSARLRDLQEQSLETFGVINSYYSGPYGFFRVN